MASMKERMDSAEMEVLIPLCISCMNAERHKFDKHNPLEPIITCRIFTKIPEPILQSNNINVTGMKQNDVI